LFGKRRTVSVPMLRGWLVAPDVKAGDRILFGKYSGSEVKLENEERLILREDDILGVLEG
jgi:chaperonin GroES